MDRAIFATIAFVAGLAGATLSSAVASAQVPSSPQGTGAPVPRPVPQPGAAGCSGPLMALMPGLKFCDLDPGKSVRFICDNGKTVDVATESGNANAPSCQ